MKPSPLVDKQHADERAAVHDVIHRSICLWCAGVCCVALMGLPLAFYGLYWLGGVEWSFIKQYRKFIELVAILGIIPFIIGSGTFWVSNRELPRSSGTGSDWVYTFITWFYRLTMVLFTIIMLLMFLGMFHLLNRAGLS